MKLYNVVSMNPLSDYYKCVSRIGAFNNIESARDAVKFDIMTTDVSAPAVFIVNNKDYPYISDGLYFTDRILESYANTDDIYDKELVIYVIEEIELDEIFNPAA